MQDSLLLEAAGLPVGLVCFSLPACTVLSSAAGTAAVIHRLLPGRWRLGRASVAMQHS